MASLRASSGAFSRNTLASASTALFSAFFSNSVTFAASIWKYS